MKLVTTDLKETENRISHLQYRLQIATHQLKNGKNAAIDFAVQVIQGSDDKKQWILSDWERCFGQQGNN